MNWEALNRILNAEPTYRARQAYRLLFHNLLNDWTAAQSLPKTVRGALSVKVPIDFAAEFFPSQDGKTVKALLTLADGARVESVLMNYDERRTVCVSTQVGCPLACTFCATGRLGLRRNLTVWEIVEQVQIFNRFLAPRKERVNNVVFMGMGEPFLNYEQTLKALRLLNDKDMFNIGARHLSVSTVGIVPAIRKLARENFPVNLAISLHAADERTRARLMPRAAQYKIAEIINAVDYYLAKTKRKVMFEYLLLAGVNDSLADAEKLAHLLAGRLAMINLLPYNPTGVFQASKAQQVRTFANLLKRHGLEVTVRDSRGADVAAACGQLAAVTK